MFRKTDPQTSMLESQFLVPPEKRARLEKSWAEPFRKRVLPLVDEEVFRDAFCEDNGRPNKSIRLLVGLHLLKEWDDLTDAQILDQFEFNLQWHYALAVDPGSAHVCQKTLHNFRTKLMEDERARRLFEQVTRAMAEMDGLSMGKQRLDSTHVLSNIAVLTRLGLFVETVTHFLKELRNEAPEAFASLNPGYGRRYLEREGYFSDAKREQARRRLPVVAQDVAALVRAFQHHAGVSALPAFGVLTRLFEEQCEAAEEGGPEDGSDEGGDRSGQGGSEGEGGQPRVKVRDPKSIASNSLQSPHDPDATYGHKGKGYEMQVSETCDEANPYQVITGTSVNGAHESDQNAVAPMLDQLAGSGMLPEELIADTGYGSGANIVQSAERHVDLQAPVPDPGAPPPAEHFTAPVAHDQQQDAAVDEPAVTVLDEPENAERDCRVGLEAFSYSASFSEVLHCPAGKAPERQHVAGGQLIAVFSAEYCTCCPMASSCPTRQRTDGERQLRRAPATIATEVRQAEQHQPSFKDRYRIRSGIESTNNELKGRHGMGDLRIRGKQPVALAAVLKSLALNVKRAVQWHVSQMVIESSCPAVA